MQKLDPRSPGFNTVKNLMNKINADRESETDIIVSVEDRDVPSWQRQIVWTADEMGLLAYSIIRAYPIGIIILWKKPNGIRVPIDGRQRLTAIKEFFNGAIAIPSLPIVDDNYKNKKYKLLSGDKERGYSILKSDDRDAFEDYELRCIEYSGIDEKTAMSIFVMLQGGKSLTKTEVRAALGGKLCDFITEITTDVKNVDEENEEIISTPRNPFFKALSENLANRRKSHRNVADTLIHEMFYPNQDKHWSSLEAMYQEKSASLPDSEKKKFKSLLAAFLKDSTIIVSKKKVLMPQLKAAFFILSAFKVWKEIRENYQMPADYNFAKSISEFETLRVEKQNEIPYVNFTAALSNAGYAQNRIQERHDILMSFVLRKYPSARPKNRDSKRVFTIEQKIAIWERANRKCEWVGCNKEFPNPRLADADHIVFWDKGGPTTIENGRLLCQEHNRGRKD